MKVDNLLTQFLYQHKRLSLPGIGTFTTDGGSVQFDNDSDKELSQDLVNYIKTHTGKMQSLAISDLESFIMLNKQFLNIGKALYMEGIGTLVKTKEGDFEFTPGGVVTERLEDLRPTQPSAFDETAPRYDQQNVASRLIVIFLIVLTIGLVGWGAWYLFKQNSETNLPEQTAVPISEPEQDSLNIIPDSNTIMNPVDSLRNSDTSISRRPVTLAGSVETGRWKFIIEEAARGRALRRYDQLKTMGKSILMETSDSVTYKLYFSLPASPSDTARIRDSLKLFYNSKKVIVE
ncbi:hypothetical protein [Flavihumibacter sp. ZG627]|uniref:hypothetical protein n=1 Tax=Flavihumibacter sp. ZG627 TaxID=1463156 RepID=UPI0012E0275B|nr:hypothetical protein [Flavihumibacter sp. ZG627]